MTIENTKYTASELERYLAGDLDAERSRVIERAQEEDRELKAWIDERRAERDAFLLDPRRKPFARLVEEAGEGQAERAASEASGDGWAGFARPGPEGRSSFFVRWWPGLSLVAAAAVVAMLFVRPAPETSSDRIGVKGGLSVKAAVLDGDRAHFFEGEQLHPGNRLRLSVDDPRGGYVTVLLEEASGGVSVLYGPNELGRLSPGTHRLPGSLQLDAELGRERIYVLVSDEEPKVDVWVKELEAAQRKTGFLHGWLPEGTTRVSTLEYEKVE